ncbi:MAG: hypothetical protein J0H02_04820 [Armatimonadetes bacterium]|nr:hypothetical protein [Armatimonadota bacterium]
MLKPILITVLGLMVATAAFAQYDEPGYHILAFGGGACNCPPRAVGTISGATSGPTGWLTVDAPCSNDGVTVPWNHYGSQVYSWSFTPPAGVCYAWSIIYATSSPNVQIPHCTGGRVPATVNPYSGVFIELPASTPCPTPEPVDPVDPSGS